ncbi:hypothetical protein ACFV7Q_37830 [Streptomyces sp. NPDC059851]
MTTSAPATPFTGPAPAQRLEQAATALAGAFSKDVPLRRVDGGRL